MLIDPYLSQIMEPDLDLDIRNYKLEDITRLFKIPLVFNESHLRSAKLAVLQTHPDKSQLPKEYFLFFSSAYKMLYQVYTFRTGKNRNNKESYKEIMAEDAIDKNKNASWDQRVSKIDQKKQMLRENLALVSKNDLECVNIYGGGSMHGYALGQGAPTEHSSGLFSSLQYEDLKKAHTESVIPVTHEDYIKSKKFNNTHDLKVFRDLNLKSYNYNNEEAMHKKNAQAYEEAEDNTHRAFMMVKQDEIAQEMNKKFNGSFLKFLQ